MSLGFGLVLVRVITPSCGSDLSVDMFPMIRGPNLDPKQ